MPTKITLAIIEARLCEMFGDLVVLAPNQEYKGMVKPLTFVDKEYGEWTTSPNNVLNKGCVHPRRKIAKREQTNLKKYGVKNPFSSKEVQKKIKKTLKDKFGVDHPSKSEEVNKKRRQNNLKKYGVEEVLQTKELQEKIKKTLKEKYGVEHSFQSEVIREKSKKTLIGRYGRDNAAKVPEIRERISQTNLERYGGKSPAASQEVRDKMSATNLKRYGGAAPICDPEIRQKIEQTNLKRYNVTNVFSNESIKQRIIEANLERYGVEHAAQHPDVLAKMQDTCLQRFGVESPLASEDIQNKIKQTNVERYGVVNPGSHFLKQDSVRKKVRETCQELYGYNYVFLEDGRSLGDYLREHSREDLNYTSCKTVLEKHGFAVLREYVEGDRKFGVTSSLEEKTSQLLEVSRHFGSVFGRRPDFKLAENLFLDVDGLYWHSSTVLDDPGYHFFKREHYLANGSRLIQIREDEIRDNPYIVKSIIQNAQNQNTKIYARKCELVDLSWEKASNFYKENHLQGAGSPAKSYGLVYDNSLVMAISFKKYKDGVEISRLCTVRNFAVIGGFSRLLKKVMSYKPKFVRSWCDLRYASGKGYEAVGFEKVRDVLSWSWTDYQNTYHRLRCRANMDKRGLSEKEHARELGWVKIYDAGQRLYELHT